MHFFSFSYYERLYENAIRLPDSAGPIRERLDQYPQFRDIPFDIQEFGILKDENGTAMVGLHDTSEFGASWFAAISGMTYQYDIAEIYEWGMTTDNLPHPRMQVIRMLEMMAGGDRVSVSVSESSDGLAGAIACVKNDNVYLFLYNHTPQRGHDEIKPFSVEIQGDIVSKDREWVMNQWSIDHDHGVWVHEFNKDCKDAGLKPKAGRPRFDRVISTQFETGWNDVYQKNLDKYLKLAVLPKTAEEIQVESVEGRIELSVRMPGNSVKLIELTHKKR
jgi:xylan 1,4-beta-xylosidase